jgi:hypothetical protein
MGEGGTIPAAKVKSAFPLNLTRTPFGAHCHMFVG